MQSPSPKSSIGQTASPLPGVSRRRPSNSAIIAFTLAALAISPAAGDETAPTPQFAPQSAAIKGAAPPDALAVPPAAQPESGVAFGNWMLYPSIFVGAVLNSNVYQTQIDRQSSAGTRFTPSIEIDQDTGLHKTTIYGNADAQVYPGSASRTGQDASTLSARAGIAHIWQPTTDLSVRFSTDFSRLNGPFGSTLSTSAPVNSATSFIGSPSAMNLAGYQQFSNQTTAALSVEKRITDQTFVSAGLGLQNVIYEQPPAGVPGSLSGIDYNAFTRFGFWVTPQVNAFTEAGLDLRRYDNAAPSNSNSYRFIGGLSSGLIGLFRGELYGGVQTQYSVQGNFAATTAPTYGGRISYYPTPYFTVAASLDQGLGSAAGTFASTRGPSSGTLQARLQADYALFESWRTSARLGYAETRATATSPTTQSSIAGAGVSYTLWRNIAVTLDYQYTNTVSNGTRPYSDNLVSAGLTYRY